MKCDTLEPGMHPGCSGPAEQSWSRVSLRCPAQQWGPLLDQHSLSRMKARDQTLTCSVAQIDELSEASPSEAVPDCFTA